jgi:MFS transporter, MHS family, proline/betaine transporter
VKKIIIATGIGTMLEWAEFTFFAYVADQLSNLFFPIHDPNIARLKMYAIFATSYLMRPFGAVFFGNIGDKYGRKPAMISSLFLMSIAAFGIGVLPTYNTIGIIAPILLMVFRMIQGVAVSGEFTGSAVLLTEHAQKYQFLAGSWTACASAVGMAIGSIAATILLSSVIPKWSWRVPFLLSAVIALIALYLRNSMYETNVFKKAKKEKKLFDTPLRAALKYNKKGLLCTVGFSIFMSVIVYTGNVYYRNMAINIGNIKPYIASAIITAGMLLTTLLIPIFAYVADKTNGYKICISGLILAIIFSPLMMSFAISGTILYTIAGQVIYAIIDAMVSATMFTLLLQKFQTGNKYSGSGIAWSITTAIFGGSSLMINEFLIGSLNKLNGPGIYISISALVCLIIMIFTSTQDVERSNSYNKISTTDVEIN